MTDTRRIYYEDVYQKEFEAEVLECRESKNGYEILLDQSVFYPEGGGQPCDLGWLDDVEVRDVQEQNGELVHLTDRAMLPGTHVHGKINWERRFDLMQQHSGEHIISGLVHEAYGYENVGFHMGSDVLTVDLSGPLDSAQLEEIERVANQKIWENVPVEITYPSKEELEVIPYRSKKALTGKVRIVTFPGIDICACCGTHVTHTGEIGMVKILSVVKFHEGVRIEMICGVRVLQYLNQIDAQNRSVSVRLSAKPKETAQAVDRLWEENFRLKGKILHMEDELFAREAQAQAGKGNVLLFQSEMEADSVRKLTDAVLQTCNGRCAVFSENADGSFKYAIGEKNGDLRSFTKEMNVALNGRGGGKPFFVQGSVKASKQEIEKYFAER
jgi:alanyl-tRNA synthetase